MFVQSKRPTFFHELVVTSTYEYNTLFVVMDYSYNLSADRKSSHSNPKLFEEGAVLQSRSSLPLVEGLGNAQFIHTYVTLTMDLLTAGQLRCFTDVSSSASRVFLVVEHLSPSSVHCVTIVSKVV